MFPNGSPAVLGLILLFFHYFSPSFFFISSFSLLNSTALRRAGSEKGRLTPAFFIVCFPFFISPLLLFRFNASPSLHPFRPCTDSAVSLTFLKEAFMKTFGGRHTTDTFLQYAVIVVQRRYHWTTPCFFLFFPLSCSPTLLLFSLLSAQPVGCADFFEAAGVHKSFKRG